MKEVNKICFIYLFHISEFEHGNNSNTNKFSKGWDPRKVSFFENANTLFELNIYSVSMFCIQSCEMTTKNWLQTQSRLRISETVTKPRPDDITLNRQSFRARQCDVCCGFSVGSDFSFRVHVNARRRHFHTLSGALSPHTAPSHYPACTGKWRWARGHVCGTRRTSKKTGVIEIFIVESGLGLVTKAGSGGRATCVVVTTEKRSFGRFSHFEKQGVYR